MMMAGHDQVVLVVDLEAHGLRAGDVGTVVMVHGHGGYEVEFAALNGDAIAVVSLHMDEVRAIALSEITRTSSA